MNHKYLMTGMLCAVLGTGTLSLPVIPYEGGQLSASAESETQEATESTQPPVQEPEKPALLRPSDSIRTTKDGVAYFPDGKKRKTGFFSVSPNFAVGDVNDDTEVDVLDASIILVASAEAGADGGQTVDGILSSTSITDAEIACLYADVNADSAIDALDAAEILIYRAKLGSGTQVNPLGTATYYADAQGALQTGWITDDDEEVYYAGADYALCTQWLELDGKRYYLGEDGVLQTGWLTLNQKTYYLNAENGSAAQIGWYKTDKGNRYFDEKGAMAVGWATLKDGIYYFNETGEKQTGWLELETGKYYLGKTGVLVTGWQTIGEKTYCFDETGAMCTGWTTLKDGTYYLSETGEKQTGWLELGTGTYYLGETGVLVTGWQTIDEKTYCFDETGAMYTGWTVLEDGTCYFSETGEKQTGWLELETGTYYLGETGVLVTGWQTIGEDRYYFDETGVLAVDQMVGDVYVNKDGREMSALYLTNKKRAEEGFAKYGTTVQGIYNYVRATTRYKKIEATKTLAQIEQKGWLAYVDYSMTHYYGVCYYLAAKTDFMLQEAGYTCRIVHSTHGSGDHYWNQVYQNGKWVNYDLTNNWYGKTWEQMVALGSYRLLGYVTPEYK